MKTFGKRKERPAERSRIIPVSEYTPHSGAWLVRKFREQMFTITPREETRGLPAIVRPFPDPASRTPDEQSATGDKIPERDTTAGDKK